MREDAEALRRRLYAPGASEADVARYRVAEPPPVPGRGSDDEPPDPGPARRRFVLPMVAVALAAVVAAGITIARVAAAAQPSLPAPTAIAMSADDRQEVEDDLASSDGSISAFLVTHTAVPALRRAERLYTLERAGTGPATVELAPVPAVAFQGKATVLLVLEQDGDASWTALRRRVDPTGEQQLVAQRSRGGRQEAGLLTTDTFRYASGDRPVELRVQVPPGARWGFAVVFSD